MNRLFLWQKEHRVTNRELSLRASCHESLICHYHAGRKNFSPSSALRISEATGGAVTVMELIFPGERAA
jgi:DNA-binding transcriptional regulator YdaS (Cro superfamily)